MARAGLVEVDWDDETLARDIFTTSCWRRYIATWAIVERKVYLKAIVGRYKLVSEEMLFAYWYTGKIVLYPHSRMSYSRSEVIFASTYRPVLVVDRGVVT